MPLLRRRPGSVTVSTDQRTEPTPIHRAAAELIERSAPRGFVLDVGCWAGSLAEALPARPYVGIDISEALPVLRALRGRVPGTLVCVADATRLPFRAGAFAAVAMVDVVEHVPAGTESAALAEVRHCLMDTGCCVVVTPLLNVTAPLDPAWPLGHRHYTHRALDGIARRAGLRVRQLSFAGGVWTSVDLLALYVAKHLLRRRYASPEWLARLVAQEGRPRSSGRAASSLVAVLDHEDSSRLDEPPTAVAA